MAAHLRLPNRKHFDEEKKNPAGYHPGPVAPSAAVRALFWDKLTSELDPDGQQVSKDADGSDDLLGFSFHPVLVKKLKLVDILSKIC